MGWLRELQRSSRLGSFDSLAKACLQHPRWPPDVRIQARSLGALLGKIDRREELEWLTSRPEVQAILAELLDSPFAELQRELPQPIAQANRWVWQDAPRATSLDLLREPLPPGIPQEVLTFAQPGSTPGAERLLWSATSGSGRSLAGRWLATHQRVELVGANGRGALEENLKARSLHHSLFVELPHPDAQTLISLAQSLSQISLKTNILVALPAALEDLTASHPFWQAFRAVQSDASGRGALGSSSTANGSQATERVDCILEWLRQRLPTDTTLKLPRVEDFIRQTVLERDWTTFGDIFGLGGSIDEVAFEARSGLERLLTNLFHKRLLRLGPDPLSPWLKKRGLSVLSGIFEQLLSAGVLAWEQPRSIDEWSRWVPEEFRHTVDVGWLKRSLPEADAHIRPRDIERAALRLSPGAFQIILALVRLGFLADKGEGLFQFAPRWLGQHLFEALLSKHVNVASPVFGMALLGEHAAWVTTRIANERSLRSIDLDRVAERVDNRGIGAVAAIEMTFRLAALNLLRGADFEASELTELWEEQLSTLIEGGGLPPLPLLSFPASQVRQQPLLSPGFFYVAALSVAERLLPLAQPHPILNPWRGGPRGEELVPILDAVVHFLAACSPRNSTEAWIGEVYLMLHRLAKRTRGIDQLEAHPAFAVSKLIAACASGTLTWNDVESLDPCEQVMHALKRVGDAELPWSAVREACWRAYEAAGSPNKMHLLAADLPFSHEFWRPLPNALAMRLLRLGRPVRLEFLEGGWPELLFDVPHALTPENAAFIPTPIAQDIVHRFERFSPNLVRTMWPSQSQICEGFLNELNLHNELQRLVNFLLRAPEVHLGHLVRSLSLTADRLTDVSFSSLEQLVLSLHAASSERLGDFVDVMELLVDLKHALHGLSPRPPRFQ